MNDREVVETITYTLIMWPNQPDVPLPQRLVAWRALIGDLDQAVVRAAIDQLATEGDRFAPPPGLVRKRAVAFTAVESGAPGPEEAWREIKAKISSVGYTTGLDVCERCVRKTGTERKECEHHWVTFSHPAIQAFVDGLGWPYLVTSQDEMADRAHFVKWYPTAVERLANRAALPESVRLLTEQIAAAPLTMGSGEG